ncbi:hypothetical protein HELRODRAFT_177726 [Helobdella robusta]|uniref:Uncharacterized protein n=1 Tax=Helobdella robusta TaxID=6412 RepID=T1FC51_HELRO|nr:hypothetical protein HELRODRAFT_177726 [Helobdella robusta]ESN97671.1 hypothetical protein HELRODRAFT_177726 [Helobdella robusta]
MDIKNENKLIEIPVFFPDIPGYFGNGQINGQNLNPKLYFEDLIQKSNEDFIPEQKFVDNGLNHKRKIRFFDEVLCFGEERDGENVEKGEVKIKNSLGNNDQNVDKSNNVPARFGSVPDKSQEDISNVIVERNQQDNVYSLNDKCGSEDCSAKNNYNIDDDNNNVKSYHIVNNIRIETINLDDNNTSNNISVNTSDSSSLKSITFGHHYARKNETCNEEVSMENNLNNETSIWSANSNTSTLTNVTVISDSSEICDNQEFDINNNHLMKSKYINKKSEVKEINKNITSKNKTNSSNFNQTNENALPADIISNKTDIKKENTANCAKNIVNVKPNECFLNSTIISSDDDRTLGLWNVSSNESKRTKNDDDSEHRMMLMRVNAFVQDRMKIMALENKYMDQHEVIPQNNYRQQQRLQLPHYKIYPNQLYYPGQPQLLYQYPGRHYQFCQDDNAISAEICHQYGARIKPGFVPNGVSSCNNANDVNLKEILERHSNPRFKVATACNGLKNHRSKHNRSQSIDNNLQTFKRNVNLMNVIRNKNNLIKDHANHKLNVYHGNFHEYCEKSSYNKVGHKTSHRNKPDGPNNNINNPTRAVVRTKKISKDVQRVCRFLRSGGKHPSLCLSQLGDV